jgi:hypothetical protein
MGKKYDKWRYYCHDFKNTAVMAESFETLAKFYEFAKENGMQVSFCPQNHASVMVSNYTVLTPEKFISSKPDNQ